MASVAKIPVENLINVKDWSKRTFMYDSSFLGLFLSPNQKTSQ